MHSFNQGHKLAQIKVSEACEFQGAVQVIGDVLPELKKLFTPWVPLRDDAVSDRVVTLIQQVHRLKGVLQRAGIQLLDDRGQPIT